MIQINRSQFGLGEFFQNFLFSKVGLTSISSDTSRNLRGFQYLDLSFNELVHVPIDSFKGLGELRHLDVKTTRSVFCHPSILRQFKFGVSRPF